MIILWGLLGLGGFLLGRELLSSKEEEKPKPNEDLPPDPDKPYRPSSSQEHKASTDTVNRPTGYQTTTSTPILTAWGPLGATLSLGDIPNEMLEQYKDASKIEIPDESKWIEVEQGGKTYKVSPTMIGPIGIGEAQKIAKANGAQLPTPELVDAIWKAADLKIEPILRQHDGTPKTMSSPVMYATQAALIQKQILEKNPQMNFRLLAGSHKDVVIGGQRELIQRGKDALGKIGIYGWHRLTGKPIQDFYTNHAHSEDPKLDWKDYSQGLRLVKDVTSIV